MRTLGFIAVLALLPACQMGLPAVQNSVENTAPVVTGDPSNKTDLAAAFEQAALAAQVEAASEKKNLLGGVNPKNLPVDAVLAGTDIEVVDGASVADKDTKSNVITIAENAPKANKKAPKKSRSTVALGTVLPFGTVGISCEARPKDMGERVDKFPSSGAAAWQIYDTDPSSIAPRTQFITGFKDGCARQVTAALILFGSPSLHEFQRYSKARAKVSWSKADNNYETIKSRVCSVGRKKPCPTGKVGKLEKHMAFVSVYKQFGDATGWLELLLHNGKLETQELR